MTVHTLFPYPVYRKKLRGGIEIAYTDVGTGNETLILLHGLSGSTQVWSKNLAELSRHTRCIAVDLPGNGLSSKGDYTFSMSFYAETIFQFIESLGLQRVALLGHSMGGQISIMMTLRYPQLVNKLLLAAPAGFEYFSSTESLLFQQMFLSGQLFYTDEQQLFSGIRESFQHFPAEGTALMEALKQQLLQGNMNYYRNMVNRSVQGMLQEQVFELLPRLSCPVLACFGLQDRFIPNRFIHPGNTRQLAEKAASRIPKCSLKLMDDCGHFLQWEKALIFNREVSDFLL